MIAVLIPTLGRPERIQPLVASLRASTAVSCRLLFLCSPGDSEPRREALSAGEEVLVVPFAPGRGDYARKVNMGLAVTDEPFVFQGSTDLHFHSKWAEHALAAVDQLEVGVVGTNDLGNNLVMRGEHSTHSLIRRAYAEECGTIDGDGALHEGYWHNWVDNELVETAKARRCFGFAALSHVEHLHPFWDKGVDDATYRKGRVHYHADQALYRRRHALWASLR